MRMFVSFIPADETKVKQRIRGWSLQRCNVYRTSFDSIAPGYLSSYDPWASCKRPELLTYSCAWFFGPNTDG